MPAANRPVRVDVIVPAVGVVIRTVESSEWLTTPGMVLISPRKRATKSSHGSEYTSAGVPTWRTVPWCMTAIRSDIVNASSWSCVT